VVEEGVPEGEEGRRGERGFWVGGVIWGGDEVEVSAHKGEGWFGEGRLDSSEDSSEAGKVLIRRQVEINKEKGGVGRGRPGVVETSLGMSLSERRKFVVSGMVDSEDGGGVQDQGTCVVFIEVVEGDGMRTKARERRLFREM